MAENVSRMTTSNVCIYNTTVSAQDVKEFIMQLQHVIWNSEPEEETKWLKISVEQQLMYAFTT